MRLSRSSLFFLLPALLATLASQPAAAAIPFPSAEGDGPQAASPARADAAKTAVTQGTYLALIRELGTEGQPYAALAHIASFEARWGATPDTQLLRADALRATSQDEAAARVYRQLLDGPRAAAGHHGLGLMAAAAGRLPEAIEHLQAAARLDPTDAATLGDLGFALLRAGQLDAARVPLMTAAQLAPKDSRALANLASYFIARGQREQAEAVLASPYVSEQARALVRGPAAGGDAGDTSAPRLRLAATLSAPNKDTQGEAR